MPKYKRVEHKGCEGCDLFNQTDLVKCDLYASKHGSRPCYKDDGKYYILKEIKPVRYKRVKVDYCLCADCDLHDMTKIKICRDYGIKNNGLRPCQNKYYILKKVEETK